MPENYALEALWPRARQYARRYCGGTLSRLRQGDGGFYDHDDFWQDVYLEFHALVVRWQAGELSDGSEDALYTAWQRLLARGGWRIYRRAPQRLWVGAELCLPPEALALDSDDSTAEERFTLPHGALAQLCEDDNGAARCERMEELLALEQALWRLPPIQRQALYLSALQDMPAALVARLLGMAGPAVVYNRMYDARSRLREVRRGID